MPDYFINDTEAESSPRLSDSGSYSSADGHTTSTAGDAAVNTADTELAKTFAAIQAMIGEDIVKSIKAVFIFDLKGMLPACT